MLYISHEPSERVGGFPPSLSDCCELDAKRAHVNFSVFARLFPELFNASNESSCFKAAFNFQSAANSFFVVAIIRQKTHLD